MHQNISWPLFHLPVWAVKQTSALDPIVCLRIYPSILLLVEDSGHSPLPAAAKAGTPFSPVAKKVLFRSQITVLLKMTNEKYIL